MIRYDRLWKTMEDKELTQYRLIKQHGFSAGQIGRLKKNMHVSTHTIDTLCTILQCGIGDIMEFCPDETSGWTGPLPAETEEPAADKPKAKKAAKGKTAAEKPEKAAKKADKSGKEKPDKDGAKPLKAEKEKPPRKRNPARATRPRKRKATRRERAARRSRPMPASHLPGSSPRRQFRRTCAFHRNAGGGLNFRLRHACL